MDGLYEKLMAYTEGDYYPMHMPGHKRRLGSMADPFSIDITEIDGFDDLHHARGILKEAQDNAASFYGSEKTYFLVNGSTCGILAAIGAACPFGGKILMARNSHKSAYHAVCLNHLRPVYLSPQQPDALMRETGVGGRIIPEDVEAKLDRDPQIRAVFITSPTYDGVVSDVAAIARIAHRHGAVLIVDEAHGAHFGMDSIFPENSVRLGADFVIHSLHKTLPSLTQTALLHVNGKLPDRAKTERLLNIYMSSSPSYVLMASMDRCIRMLQQQGAELFGRYNLLLDEFERRTENLRILRRMKTDDPSKIIIACPEGSLSGMQIASLLREKYHIEPEMTAPRYVLCLTSVGDDREGFRRLSDALLKEDERLSAAGAGKTDGAEENRPAGRARVPVCICAEAETEALPEKKMEIYEAWDLPDEMTDMVPLRWSAGRVSCEFICLYPPGIPLIAPGERIPEKLPDFLARCLEEGFEIQGLADTLLIRCAR